MQVLIIHPARTTYARPGLHRAYGKIESAPAGAGRFQKMPHDLPKAYDPTAIEDHWAEYWVREKLFAQPTPSEEESLDGRSSFTILLPPPNVTGNLHMGHMFEHTESDILIRWHRMRGDRVLWIP